MLDIHSLFDLFYIFRHAHPGSPYVFGLAGADLDVDFPEPMPIVGMHELLSFIK